MAEYDNKNHKPTADGGIMCKYTNSQTGDNVSFYLDEPPCPDSDYMGSSTAGSQLSGFSKDRVAGRFGGGNFSGGTQGQISRGFGSNRATNMVTGLGGSQIARAKTGRSVSFNPIYNKPKFVVSANMRELRRRKVRSQQPILKLGARRTQ